MKLRSGTTLTTQSTIDTTNDGLTCVGEGHTINPRTTTEIDQAPSIQFTWKGAKGNVLISKTYDELKLYVYVETDSKEFIEQVEPLIKVNQSIINYTTEQCEADEDDMSFKVLNIGKANQFNRHLFIQLFNK